MSIKTMEARIKYLGGNNLGRLNKQKHQSFTHALKNSYNSRVIKTNNKGAWPCLFNEFSVQSDYDKKYLSVSYEAGLEPGDTFEFVDSKNIDAYRDRLCGTHWMVYLPRLTETAYLRTEIIRCEYSITLDNTKYWIYFQGPTETQIDWKTTKNISYNELNYSGTIYIKNDTTTKEFFKRFTTFKIEGKTWRVAVVDSISVPGILELEIQEYFNNTIAELPQIVKEQEPTVTDPIIGKSTCKQGDILGFTIGKEYYDEAKTWMIADNNRVKIIETVQDGYTCKVKVLDGAIRTFKICYGSYTKTVTIDTSENVIKGSDVVYPYDIRVYYAELPVTYDSQGQEVITSITSCVFYEDSHMTILETGSNYCKVEIISSKSDKFNLKAKVNGVDYTLPITIKSL